MNQCCACNQDFSSTKIFDRHRVGSHQYKWSLEHPAGRRCLGVGEMEDLGWELNKAGRWYDPAKASQTGKYFSRAA